MGGYRDVQFTAKAYYAEPGAGSVYENLSTWQAYDAMKAEIDLVERDRIIRELGDQLFYGYAGMPLLNLGASIVVDPAVVKECVYPGSTREIITHLEYVEAANTK